MQHVIYVNVSSTVFKKLSRRILIETSASIPGLLLFAALSQITIESISEASTSTKFPENYQFYVLNISSLEILVKGTG